MNLIAKIISVVFNPLVISPFTFYILIFNDHNPNNYLLFFIAIFFSSILPFSSIVYFKKLGKISSLEAPIRKQRLELLVMSSVYNSIAFILLKYFHASNIVQGLMFCYAINTAITWLITRHWKISIHMIGIRWTICCPYTFWVQSFIFHDFDHYFSIFISNNIKCS